MEEKLRSYLAERFSRHYLLSASIIWALFGPDALLAAMVLYIFLSFTAFAVFADLY